MRQKQTKGLPEFRSLEEEREYWEARGPMAEGHEGRVSKPKPGQRRSSFLVVRLTGEELTRLRDIAAAQGLGPSTYARRGLLQLMEHKGRPSSGVPLEQFREALLTANLPEVVDGAVGRLPYLHRVELSKVSREDLEQFYLQMSSFLALLGVQCVFEGDAQKKEEASVERA